MEQSEEIIKDILAGWSVVIVGPSDAGKTHWIHGFLIPKLKSLGKTVAYFEDGDAIADDGDIAIFDEAETLFDAEELQKAHPEEAPYYSKEYLERVRSWHEKYSRHHESSVYVISRHESDVRYLVDNFVKADWDGRALKTFGFAA